jgi:hypothetical protein
MIQMNEKSMGGNTNKIEEWMRLGWGLKSHKSLTDYRYLQFKRQPQFHHLANGIKAEFWGTLASESVGGHGSHAPQLLLAMCELRSWGSPHCPHKRHQETSFLIGAIS